MKNTKLKLTTFSLAVIIATSANAANTQNTLSINAPVAPVNSAAAEAPKPATIPPAPPAAPTAPAVKAPAAPAAKAVTQPVAAKPATPQKPVAAKATAPEKPVVAAVAKPDEATLKQLNKKHLLDFINAALAGDVRSFYKANPQFARSMTEAQFVNKFGKYKELPNDTEALKANDFAETKITTIENNKRYKGCQLVEAKSDIKLQVVQDSHHYKLTNRYCYNSEGYKLVSFKLGYEE